MQVTREPRVSPGRRFSRKYATSDGCWPWIARKECGYGRFFYNGRMGYAHRFSFEHFVGPIPDGLEIDHVCRNPGCVNPAHLEAVPHLVNKERATAHRRLSPPAWGCGHQPTAENVYATPRGVRECRECRRFRRRAANRRQRNVCK